MSQAESSPSVAGAHQALHKLSQELPDACERLDYVKRMTDQAASKVLTLVDSAQDDADAVRRQGSELSESLQRLAVAPDLSVERARAMMRLCAAYAASAAGFAERVKGLQTEIMMAQDFQDLSGQVINKVLGMLRPAEAPLQELLAQFEAAEPTVEEQLAGVQTPDKALQQDDVDALLAEMGF
ncbi:protein phosphatase CheZ [Roseateles depolymerans]|uniref:Protein phosphatase CheZ n=1 Tax=Roseateles depolymerans TaxID=76731 RepID=A0A0U3MAS3_9BURK|nr:protein phosphatase CheZ [Roseateles depolymerans]ALV05401.1 Protein phosphatase CheZ [Roseateles depolymerans]REG14583.1 chemotaxis protein CheZ [Roseateles depolymerans]